MPRVRKIVGDDQGRFDFAVAGDDHLANVLSIAWQEDGLVGCLKGALSISGCLHAQGFPGGRRHLFNLPDHVFAAPANGDEPDAAIIQLGQVFVVGETAVRWE